MNLQQIDYILAVSDVKSFGRAAAKCYVSQSTLSTMVARFEDEIGIKLFDRKTKPITITAEGEQVIQQLKVISKEMSSLNEVIQSLKGEITGELKIGVLPTVGPYLLPLFVKDFAEKFPNIHFEISEVTTGVIIDHLKKRRLDIGIVSIPLREPDLLEIPLYQEPFLVYDTTGNHSKKTVRIDDIDFNSLWLLEEGHCLRSQIESICRIHKRVAGHRNLDYKLGTIDTLLKFVRRHRGVTLLPLLATLDFSKDELDRLQRLEAPVPARSIGLLVHKHFVKKGILEWFKLEIREKVAPLLSTGPTSKKLIPPV